MSNLLIIIAALASVLGTVTVTYIILRYIWKRLPGVLNQRMQMLTAVMSVFAVHFINIFLYATAFYGLTHIMAKESLLSFADYYYFASTTYAAMGTGNTAPILSELRLLTAVEAVNGIVLIIASIGFIHAMMRKFWFRVV